MPPIRSITPGSTAETRRGLADRGAGRMYQLRRFSKACSKATGSVQRIVAGARLLDAVVLMSFKQVLRHGRDDGWRRNRTQAWRRQPPQLGDKEIAGDAAEENMGTKTMQMARVETKAGTAICAAPSRMAVSTGPPCPGDRCFRWSVASSTTMPTARASDRSTMLIVCPTRKASATSRRWTVERNGDDEG